MICKLSPQLICVLTIGHLICCLNLHYSRSESPDRSNIWKLDLKGSGVFHNNKLREEDEYDAPRKDNKSEGGAQCMKCELCNKDKSDSYNDVNEDIYDVEIMR